jgi:hypothetical protein
VSLPIRDPIDGGGYADIFRGTHEKSKVAVKKLRFFGSEEDKILSHRVGSVQLSRWWRCAYQDLGLLQGSSRLEAISSSIYFAVYWRRC